jgi:hypothetical protein
MSGPPWTRAPGALRGPPHPREPTAVGCKIHGQAAAFSFKSPWEILYSHAGPPTYKNSCS